MIRRERHQPQVEQLPIDVLRRPAVGERLEQEAAGAQLVAGFDEERVRLLERVDAVALYLTRITLEVRVDLHFTDVGERGLPQLVESRANLLFRSSHPQQRVALRDELPPLADLVVLR